MQRFLMLNSFSLHGSRGIGFAIGKRAARDVANVIVAAKTAEPHPKPPGSIHRAVGTGTVAVSVDPATSLQARSSAEK